MPVKLNIGLSRKVGEANYGSRGASVNLEVELDFGIISDQQRFQEQVTHQTVHRMPARLRKPLGLSLQNYSPADSHFWHFGFD